MSEPSHKPTPQSDGRIPFRERLTCTIPQAAEVTGLSRDTIERLISAGRLDAVPLPSVRVAGRGRRLIAIPSLVRLVEGQADA